MKIENGPILPGVRIGNVSLNITKNQLLEIIKNEYKERFRENDSVIEIENAKFWIASDGKVDQIGVGGDFKGKYKNIIGIGSTLSDVKKFIGDYINVYDTYNYIYVFRVGST